LICNAQVALRTTLLTLTISTTIVGLLTVLVGGIASVLFDLFPLNGM